MATKTKADLEKELFDNQNEIRQLKCELEKANRVEVKNNAATDLYEMYEAFTAAGFTSEQAWELTKIAVGNSTATTRTLR